MSIKFTVLTPENTSHQRRINIYRDIQKELICFVSDAGSLGLSANVEFWTLENLQELMLFLYDNDIRPPTKE